MRTTLCAVAGLALIGASCGRTGAREKVLTPVRAVAIESAETSRETRYSANILPNTRVDVAFRVGGYVTELHSVSDTAGLQRPVEEGDRVERGTVLARVRQDDYAARVGEAKWMLAEAVAALAVAKSQSGEAQAALRQSEIDFARASNLLQSESLTRADYDNVATKLDIAKARAAAAGGQVEASQRRIGAAEHQLKEAEIAFGDTELRAPIDGTVLRRPIEVGTLVAPGTPGVVLADTSSVKVVFGVPDAAVTRLRLGQRLAATTDAILGVDFAGRITRIAPAADPRSRLFDVELTVPNRGQQLRPGMIASVAILEAGPKARVPVLPLSAIVPSKTDQNYAVFVLERQNSGHVARLREVRLGEAVGNAIAVLDGVRLGELVVTNGSHHIIDGEQVQVVP